MFTQHKIFHTMKRLCSFFVGVFFLCSTVIPPQIAQAQTLLNLPLPGIMVPLTSQFVPPMIKGINLVPEKPLQFDFIIDNGDSDLEGAEFNQEATKLIKYFLAALTMKEKDMWVNLSPYEKDRIIPTSFGQTEMGRDLLAQDYLLKQLTASLLYPEDDLGKEFWNRVYTKAQAQFGTTEIPLNTFNKVWIVPQSANVYEHEKGAFVVDSHLKVMLEEDYLALESNRTRADHGLGDVTKDDLNVISGISSEIVREILIPEIEKEVNEGKHFANLRQIFNSMILATWYKENLKETFLGQVYVDQNKLKGVELNDLSVTQKIYEQYLKAFKTGVYDYIKEDYDPATQQIIPRKYFSGGVEPKWEGKLKPVSEEAMSSSAIRSDNANVVSVNLHTYNESSLEFNQASSPGDGVNKTRRIFLQSLLAIFVETKYGGLLKGGLTSIDDWVEILNSPERVNHVLNHYQPISSMFNFGSIKDPELLDGKILPYLGEAWDMNQRDPNFPVHITHTKIITLSQSLFPLAWEVRNKEKDKEKFDVMKATTDEYKNLVRNNPKIREYLTVYVREKNKGKLENYDEEFLVKKIEGRFLSFLQSQFVNLQFVPTETSGFGKVESIEKFAYGRHFAPVLKRFLEEGPIALKEDAVFQAWYKQVWEPTRPLREELARDNIDYERVRPLLTKRYFLQKTFRVALENGTAIPQDSDSDNEQIEPNVPEIQTEDIPLDNPPALIMEIDAKKRTAIEQALGSKEDVLHSRIVETMGHQDGFMIDVGSGMNVAPSQAFEAQGNKAIMLDLLSNSISQGIEKKEGLVEDLVNLFGENSTDVVYFNSSLHYILSFARNKGSDFGAELIEAGHDPETDIIGFYTKILDRILSQVKEVLKPNGRVYFINSSNFKNQFYLKNGQDQTLVSLEAKLEEHGFSFITPISSVLSKPTDKGRTLITAVQEQASSVVQGRRKFFKEVVGVIATVATLCNLGGCRSSDDDFLKDASSKFRTDGDGLKIIARINQNHEIPVWDDKVAFSVNQLELIENTLDHLNSNFFKDKVSVIRTIRQEDYLAGNPGSKTPAFATFDGAITFIAIEDDSTNALSQQINRSGLYSSETGIIMIPFSDYIAIEESGGQWLDDERKRRKSSVTKNDIETSRGALDEKKFFSSTLVHEMAHAFHFKLSSDDKNEIITLYNEWLVNGSRYDFGGINFEHAKKSEWEFFAELAEAFIVNTQTYFIDSILNSTVSNKPMHFTQLSLMLKHFSVGNTVPFYRIDLKGRFDDRKDVPIVRDSNGVIVSVGSFENLEQHSKSAPVLNNQAIPQARNVILEPRGDRVFLVRPWVNVNGQKTDEALSYIEPGIGNEVFVRESGLGEIVNYNISDDGHVAVVAVKRDNQIFVDYHNIQTVETISVDWNSSLSEIKDIMLNLEDGHFFIAGIDDQENLSVYKYNIFGKLVSTMPFTKDYSISHFTFHSVQGNEIFMSVTREDSFPELEELFVLNQSDGSYTEKATIVPYEGREINRATGQYKTYWNDNSFVLFTKADIDDEFYVAIEVYDLEDESVKYYQIPVPINFTDVDDLKQVGDELILALRNPDFIVKIDLKDNSEYQIIQIEGDSFERKAFPEVTPDNITLYYLDFRNEIRSGKIKALDFKKVFGDPQKSSEASSSAVGSKAGLPAASASIYPIKNIKKIESRVIASEESDSGQKEMELTFVFGDKSLKLKSISMGSLDETTLLAAVEDIFARMKDLEFIDSMVVFHIKEQKVVISELEKDGFIIHREVLNVIDGFFKSVSQEIRNDNLRKLNREGGYENLKFDEPEGSADSQSSMLLETLRFGGSDFIIGKLDAKEKRKVIIKKLVLENLSAKKMLMSGEAKPQLLFALLEIITKATKERAGSVYQVIIELEEAGVIKFIPFSTDSGSTEFGYVRVSNLMLEASEQTGLIDFSWANQIQEKSLFRDNKSKTAASSSIYALKEIKRVEARVITAKQSDSGQKEIEFIFVFGEDSLKLQPIIIGLLDEAILFAAVEDIIGRIKKLHYGDRERFEPKQIIADLQKYSFIIHREVLNVIEIFLKTVLQAILSNVFDGMVVYGDVIVDKLESHVVYSELALFLETMRLGGSDFMNDDLEGYAERKDIVENLILENVLTEEVVMWGEEKPRLLSALLEIISKVTKEKKGSIYQIVIELEEAGVIKFIPFTNSSGSKNFGYVLASSSLFDEDSVAVSSSSIYEVSNLKGIESQVIAAEESESGQEEIEFTFVFDEDFLTLQPIPIRRLNRDTLHAAVEDIIKKMKNLKPTKFGFVLNFPYFQKEMMSVLKQENPFINVEVLNVIETLFKTILQTHIKQKSLDASEDRSGLGVSKGILQFLEEFELERIWGGSDFVDISSNDKKIQSRKSKVANHILNNLPTLKEVEEANVETLLVFDFVHKISKETNERPGSVYQVLREFKESGMVARVPRDKASGYENYVYVWASSSVPVGGIDFNSSNLDMKIKRDGKGVSIPIWEQPLNAVNIEGFIPVIINVVPAHLPQLLGLVDVNEPMNSAQDKSRPHLKYSRLSPMKEGA